MDEIQVIQGIEGYEKDGVVYLRLETIARGLGFVDTSKGENKEYMYWTSGGGKTVILRKVDASGDSAAGITFDIVLPSANNTVTVVKGPLTSSANGYLYAGTLGYGTYYLRELKPGTSNEYWWFTLTVDASTGQVTVSDRRNSM